MNAQNVGTILDALAARLGAPAAHLWAVLIRQAYVAAGQSVALLAVIVVAGLVWKRQLLDRAMSYEPENSYDERGTALWIAATIVGVVVAILFSVAVVSAVTDVGYALNPEAYALQTVLGAIR